MVDSHHVGLTGHPRKRPSRSQWYRTEPPARLILALGTAAEPGSVEVQPEQAPEDAGRRP